jgi:hypothetical protein
VRESKESRGIPEDEGEDSAQETNPGEGEGQREIVGGLLGHIVTLGELEAEA